MICEVAFTTGPGSDYRAEVVADSPAMYLRTGETSGTVADDETANNNNGAYVNTPTLGATGALDDDANTAVTLNGTDEYVQVTDAASLDLGDVFTLECWVKTSTAGRQIFSKGTNAYQLVLDGSGNVQLLKQNVAAIVTSTVAVNDNAWHHVAATKNGAIATKIYIDGVDRTGTVTNQTCADSATDLFIGVRSTLINYWNGSLDEPAIYATALTQARVQAHFRAAKPWTDVSQYLLGFSTRRGRQQELAAVDSGSAAVRLDNRDRRFDPTHTSGPYAPNVLPMRRLRLRASFGGTAYPLLQGYVDHWPQEWEGPTLGFTDLPVVDAFLPLSRVDIGEGETWPAEPSGARITRILDAAGWPATKRSIDTGYSEIAEQTVAVGTGVTALAQLVSVADAELGIFFIDARGRAVFHDRQHRRASSYLTSQGTFGDALSGGLPYKDIKLATDVERLWNDVQVTAVRGSVRRAEDTVSQDVYLRRTLARSVALSSDTEAQDQADYLLSVYKDPRYRVAAMTLAPQGADALWPHALGRELGDHITAKRLPQGVGGTIVQECAIEAVEQRWQPGRWETAWQLSTSAYSAVAWWLLEDSTYGVLDSTTKVIY